MLDALPTESNWRDKIGQDWNGLTFQGYLNDDPTTKIATFKTQSGVLVYLIAQADMPHVIENADQYTDLVGVADTNLQANRTVT